MSNTDLVIHHADNNGDDQTNEPAHTLGKSSKKRKPRKRGKKPAVLPTLAAAESHLTWKTRHTPTLGRHAIAKEKIPQGQRVLVEEAVAAVPRERFASVLCHQCFKNFSEFRALDGAEKDFPKTFCSMQCYRASHLYNSELTDVFDELRDMASQTNCDMELLTLIVKLRDLRHDEEGEKSDEDLGERSEIWWSSEDSTDTAMKSGWGDVRGLVRHWDKMGEEWKKSVTDACKMLRERLKHIPRFSNVEVYELQELAATVNTNSHGLGSVGAENTDLALGLFPVLSMFNHSCHPNCCFSGTGHVMTVRALRDIAPGEQLTVSYINLMEPRWLRQQLLQETRYFVCACSRCAEDIHPSSDKLLEGVQCPNPKCPGLLIGCWNGSTNDATWSCLECQKSFSSTKNPHSYEHHQVSHPEPRQEQSHNHGCHCCHGHHHPQEMTREEEENVPLPEPFIHAKGNKDGKFDPGSILALAQESLTRAMQAYSERQLPKAIRLLEHHIKTFEVVLNPFHVCVFDALTPLLNCYRSIDYTNAALQICQRILQSFDKVLKTCSLEQSNFQKILGELYQQKMHNNQCTTQSAVVSKLMKKHAQEAFRKCHAMRMICCGPHHPCTVEALNVLKAL